MPLASIADITSEPLTLVGWMRKSDGATLLQELTATGEPPTHALLDTVPQSKPLHYLRALLVTVGCLPERTEYLERLDVWTDNLLAMRAPGTVKPVRRFATWHILRKARRRQDRRAFTESSGKWARQQISVAADFTDWVTEHGATLDRLTQADMDLWLASGSTRRYLIRDFVRWGKRNRLVANEITVPRRVVKESTAPVEEDDRWDLLRRLLHEDVFRDHVRVSGALVLIYGQHLSRIVRLTTDAVSDLDGDVVTMRVGRSPVTLPPQLAAALARLTADDDRGHSTVTRAVGHRWLFPGGQPGAHITPEHLRHDLAAAGINLRAVRGAALQQFALDVPAPVLATSLGLHINTAVAWRSRLQADYTDYVAARVSRVTS